MKDEELRISEVSFLVFHSSLLIFHSSFFSQFPDIPNSQGESSAIKVL